MPSSAADRVRSRLSRLVAPAVLLLACQSGTEPRRATVLAIVTPPPSTARSGILLDAAPVVELRDESGVPVAEAGVAVSVAVVENANASLGGTMTRATDANGRATFPDLIIDATTGSYTLRFSAPGLTAAVSTPFVLGPGPAATLTAASPLALPGTVGASVPSAPSVVVKDGRGNVVPNVAVTFTSGNAGATLTGASSVTNAAGVATLGSWTLPTVPGQYTVSAAATGLAGNPVVFTATAAPDAPQVMQATEGQGQSSLYGGRLAASLQVRVVDQYGNPTPGVVVTWGSVTGAGTVEPINVATDAGGVVRSNYRLGTTPGENVVRASINPRGLSVDFSVVARGFTSQVGTAMHHSCALDDAGVAWCWGDNSSGQIGDNSTTNRPVPTAVGGALRFRRLSVGTGTTCALTTDDVPYCWGLNHYAAIGDGTTSDALVPTAVAGDHHFAEISTSGRVTCGVTAAGAAWCWGSNQSLSLGVGSRIVDACPPSLGMPSVPCSWVPVPVTGGLTFSSISVGLLHTCALQSSGQLYCWGNRFAFGAASNGGEDNWGEPVPVAGSPSFSEVTLGDTHTCGVVAPSSAYCWGNGTHGTLGTGQMDQQQDTPALLGGLAASHVDAGSLGTCATLTDGRAACWGYNQTGAVGDDSKVDRASPAIVASGQTFTAISTSGYHACARTANGQVYCWGNNVQGQLGNGGGPDTQVPVLARP
jgi:alpha-tubulin suppressor-like RCC1 family protein